MTYPELKEAMNRYHLGEIGILEMRAAIALWQRKEFGGIAEWKPGDETIRMGRWNI